MEFQGGFHGVSAERFAFELGSEECQGVSIRISKWHLDSSKARFQGILRLLHKSFRDPSRGRSFGRVSKICQRSLKEVSG